MHGRMIRLLDDAQGARLSRRRVLQGAGILGIGLSATTLLAACADDADDGVEDVPDEETDDDEEVTAAEPDDDAADDPDDEEEADEEVEGDITTGGTLSVALQSDLTTMDPHMSTAAVDRQVYQLVFNKLVDVNEDLEIIPELAEDWEISEDGTEYTIHLVDGVTFHDGEPLDAEAVQFNFERMLDEEFGSPRLSEIAQVEDVEIVDDTTIILHLDQAFSPLLATLTDRAGMIISPTAIDELGDDVARQPVGSGPFQFVEWATDDHLTVERNDDYWQDGLPYLDQVIYRPITDGAVRFTSLQSDEVQMIDSLSARDIEPAQEDPDLVYSEVPSLGFTYIALNLAEEPFDEPALRQAMAWCIDREAINETLFFGTGDPAQSPISPSSWAYDAEHQTYQQDYDMAQEKLEEGGMPDGFEFSMLVSNTPDAIQLAEAYQSQLGEVGINAELELLEFGTLLDRVDAEDFQAVSLSWSGRPDPDGNIYGYFHSDGGLNRYSYSNPEVDQLLEETRAVDDLDERAELYSQAVELIAEDAPMVFIRYAGQIKVHQPNVQGFVHISDGMMRLRDVWLDNG